MRTRKGFEQLINERGKCELCADTRGLQVHHIIPKVCELGDENLDDPENLIVVCRSCHAKLTPHKLLTVHGLKKVRYITPISRMAGEFLERVQREEPETASEVIEIYNSVLRQYMNN